MIKSDEEYVNAKQALEEIELSLIDLKKNVYSLNPERYYLMAEPYINYIKKIRLEIDTYSGYMEAVEKSIPLWIRLKGPHIGEGTVQMSVLSDFFNNFKLGIQRIVLYSYKDALEKVGRPDEEIRKLCNFKATILPGSLKIGISFPTYQTQVSLQDKTVRNPVKESVNKLLDAATWSAIPDDKQIEKVFPNEKERKLILFQLDKISPKSNGEISDVEFTGTMISKGHIKLNIQSTDRIKKAISKTIPPQEIIAEGIMREIDLDEKHFYLRERPNHELPIRCQYDETLMEDAIGGLDKRIKISGVLIRNRLNKPTHINVSDIEILGFKEEKT